MKGPPPGKSPFECCQIPELISQDVFKTCETANPAPAGPPSPDKMASTCCVAECVMNTTKVMVAGKPDKAAAIAYLTSKLAGDAESIKVRI